MSEVKLAEVVGSGQSKVHLNEATREINAVIIEVLRLNLYSVKLEGYERNLFTKSFSFSDAPKNFTDKPTLAPANCLQDLIELSVLDIATLETELKMLLGPITAFLESYTFDSKSERPDAIFLQYFFKFFLELPIASFREVYFREKKRESCKHKVLGVIDVVAGRRENGKKPSVTVSIDGSSYEKIILGSICEAKNITVRLSGHLEDSRTPEDADIKSIYQPITELCALSELCTYADNGVPLVNIYASRHTYRPFLYFKYCDVLLTTRTPITYVRTDKKAFDIHGLVFLKLLFLFDRHPFKKQNLEKITKSMWEGSKNGERIYDGVWLSTEAPGTEDASRDPNIMPFEALTAREIVKRRTTSSHDFPPPQKRKEN